MASTRQWSLGAFMWTSRVGVGRGRAPHPAVGHRRDEPRGLFAPAIWGSEPLKAGLPVAISCSRHPNE